MPTPPRKHSEFVDRSGPENLRVRTVMPILTVNDLHASLAFYRALGFHLSQEWGMERGGPGAEVKAGSLSIILNQDDFKKGKDREKGIAFRLNCQTVQDLDEVAEAIKARGGTLVQEPTTHPWGMRDIVVRDPDGFTLSIGNWNWAQ